MSTMALFSLWSSECESTPGNMHNRTGQVRSGEALPDAPLRGKAQAARGRPPRAPFASQ